MVEKLPRTLQIAVDRLAAAGRPMDWQEFCCVGKFNAYRHLKRRELIRDTVTKYKPGDAYTGPRPSLYVLTDKGKSHVSASSSETPST